MIDQRRALAAACALVALALAFGIPAAAQRMKDVPQAFAVVQAPESALEVCLASSVQAALDCARKRCHKSAGRGSCFAVTACEPVGWAGLMGVQLSEVHFASAVCGAPSRDAVLAALKAFCEGQPGAKECNVTHLWSPDGKQHKGDATFTPAADIKK